MKNKIWYSALIVSLCLVSFVFIYGCGNATGGGGGGGGGSTMYKSGRLVDPYIENAIVLVDINGNGSFDAGVTGEMIATTDANGVFTFTESPSLGATIITLVQGIHLGVTYDAGLARYVDGIGGLDISPMTTLLSYGISAESIVHILRDYAAITVDASAVRSDPMSGLDLSSPSSIANIRGSIAIYCLLKVLDDLGVTEESTILATIENSAPIRASIANMGLAISTALSDDILNTINTTIDVISADIYTGSGGYSNALPHATASDVASTAFTITRFVVAKVIANSGSGYTNPILPPMIEAYAQNVGMLYYLNNNKGFIIIPLAYTGAPIHTMQDAIDAGYIPGVTSSEVNATSEAYGINGYGTIEVIY